MFKFRANRRLFGFGFSRRIFLFFDFLFGYFLLPPPFLSHFLQLLQDVIEPIDKDLIMLVEKESQILFHLVGRFAIGHHHHDIIGQFVVHVHR